MCKIIMIADASKVVDFNDFSRYMAEIMADMSDGYGFAALGKEGVFGVKSLMPSSYAQCGYEIPDFCEPVEQSFGTMSEVTGPAIFHGRMSTSGSGLINTHPIQRDNWHLIHNGVVTHRGQKYQTLTTNDSEHVLFNLINGIDEVAQNLTGYYSFGAIDPHGFLHVGRDAIAQLYYGFSEVLKSPIFATNQEIIELIGEYLGEEMVGIKVKDNTYLVYDGTQCIENRSFVSQGYDSFSASKSEKSLGFKLSDNIVKLDSYEGFRVCPTDRINSDDAPQDDNTIDENEVMAMYLKTYKL